MKKNDELISKNNNRFNVGRLTEIQMKLNPYRKANTTDRKCCRFGLIEPAHGW